MNTISQALRDLSALVLKEKRKKVVVKVMYDRGSWEQLWNAHAPVTAQEWVPLDLPKLEDVQGLELEVIVSLAPLYFLLTTEFPSCAAGYFPCQVYGRRPKGGFDQQ